MVMPLSQWEGRPRPAGGSARRTRPGDCVAGPTFAGAEITADADIVVDGLLLDFKSARRPLAEMSQRTAWQLTGYLLLNAADQYRIDTIGLCLTRSGVLASWPVDDYLALLGACRRDLTELRGLFAELLAGCRGQAAHTSQRYKASCSSSKRSAYSRTSCCVPFASCLTSPSSRGSPASAAADRTDSMTSQNLSMSMTAHCATRL